MRIIDLLKSGAIELNTSLATKEEAIDKLVVLHDAVGNLADRQEYKHEILLREEQGTTAIGEGIAVPHAKSDSVKVPGLSAITVKGGVDYEAPDGKPSDILFMIAAPMDGDLHLEILSRLMVMLMEPEFCNALRNAKTAGEFLQIIDKKESEKYPDEVKGPVKKDGYRILAVTACPTGIAHTYMAAEALEKAGEKMGYPLKAETNGSGGAKNVLTKAEIANCDGIIIAADKNVEMARFDGKPVVKTSVSNGINKPEELIQRIVDGKAPVYHEEGGATASADDDLEKESFGHKIYKHLMNGVSHMLPFVVGGGVLIALGFLIDTLMGNATMPDGSANGSFGFTSFAASVPFWIGKVAFGFMLPVLAGYIAQSIADRPGLLPGMIGGMIAAQGYTFNSMFENQNMVGDSTAVSGFLGALFAGFAAGLIVNLLKKVFSWLPKAMDGIKPVFLYPLFGTFLVGALMCLINPVIGVLNTAVSNGLSSLGETSQILLSIVLAAMMATDMGGPFNKAAYVFGTAAIADGNTWIMAAVMIGGMVPPIAIALSTTFAKKFWTEEEIKSGPVNYLMGLCFITEGAIPYAASDPLRVIPSCMVGSALAGALTAVFHVTCPAPHGGIFTFAVCDHPLLYIVALVAGSLLGGVVLTLLKALTSKKKA
ncbi:PTS fructose transporter subunit IIABC [Eubacterium coprostanoligenes]|uniref:PTS fructose transporter subunit IIABC n=1 Tax=Eubacterium coprostanoligenes TaxID=290054 RepID=UPI00235698AF|nr:fructose-specific PTS transporter subunit EIIC [Eubacterium coprostanoligenes]MCI6253581.1 fructose-specific PTS transporter subunit EIIC [Eubacterium coprostanoligenes]MDY5399359.1 fructose-specific PTS transporter subunit EIIC [Eubacterium coprostanoligenes]